MLQDNDIQAVQKLNEAYRLITEQLGRVIVGQQQVIEELLIAMFARGHCLLVGVPGLAKTLMIRTLADALALHFSRIQFTPDLMPADITGTEVIQEDKLSGSRGFKFLKGPIFANVILADEINRTPPKTQSALLEAMQEYQITAGGTRHRLAEPFFVLATQNPIEHEGTYPLPEAQLDRFMFHILVDYPSEDEEFRIVRQTTADVETQVAPTLSGEQILALQKIVRRVPVADHVIRYALDLVRRTRAVGGRRPRFHPLLRAMGRRSPRQPVPDPRRQGPGRAARPLPCRLRGRAGGGLSCVAASHPHELQRRGRRDQDRRNRAAADRHHDQRRRRGGRRVQDRTQ